MPSFSANPAKRKIIHHNIPGKPWEEIGADIFTLNNKYYLSIVDYHSKFPIVKRAENTSAERLILECKLIHSTLPITKTYVEILLHYRQLFIKGDIIIGEWTIFGVKIFLCYSQFFNKGDFVIGGVECIFRIWIMKEDTV